MARIGILLTSDNDIDPELWRWCPPGVSLHITRIPCMDDWGGDPSSPQLAAVADATRLLTPIRPEVIVYACTSASFLYGAAGEQILRETMLAAGAPRAITSSGAVVDALRALGVRRVAIGTPYKAESTSRALPTFLAAAGFEPVSLAWHSPQAEGRELIDLTPADVIGIAERAMHPDAEALFLSCAAVDTIDLLGPLSRASASRSSVRSRRRCGRR